MNNTMSFRLHQPVERLVNEGEFRIGTSGRGTRHLHPFIALHDQHRVFRKSIRFERCHKLASGIYRTVACSPVAYSHLVNCRIPVLYAETVLVNPAPIGNQYRKGGNRRKYFGEFPLVIILTYDLSERLPSRHFLVLGPGIEHIIVIVKFRQSLTLDKISQSRFLDDSP